MPSQAFTVFLRSLDYHSILLHSYNIFYCRRNSPEDSWYRGMIVDSSILADPKTGPDYWEWIRMCHSRRNQPGGSHHLTGLSWPVTGGWVGLNINSDTATPSNASGKWYGAGVAFPTYRNGLEYLTRRTDKHLDLTAAFDRVRSSTNNGIYLYCKIYLYSL